MNTFDQYRSVLFDLDGTLFDTLPAIVAQIDAVLAEASLAPVDPVVLRIALSDGFDALFDAALTGQALPVPLRTALLQSMARRCASIPVAAVPRYDGAAACIAALTARGLRLGICTNRDRASTLALIDAAGWRDCFDAVVAQGDGLAPKPSPEPVRALLRRLETPAGQALLIGDSIVDARAAEAAGVAFAAHLGGYASHPDVLQPRRFAFDRYSALCPIGANHG